MVVSLSLPIGSIRESTTPRTQDIEEPNSPVLPCPDTPTRIRITDDPEFMCSFAQSQRQALVEYLGGETYCSSVEYFFEKVLPPISPHFNIENVFERCIKDRVLFDHRKRGHRKREDGDKYTWKGFEKDPRNNTKHETKVFKPLDTIFELVTDIAKKEGGTYCPEPTTYLYSDGNTETWSEKNSKLKPDAHVYLKIGGIGYPKKLNKRHWYNSVFVLQFKKHSNEIAENCMQIIQSLHYSMSNDACRRFTLGATIDNTVVKLWLYNRSMIVVSEEFDFTKEPRLLIKLILSLAFANRVDLGFDPLVTAKYCKNQRVYDFIVSGKTYKTSTSYLISDLKANGVNTTGTRIFKAFSERDWKLKKLRPYIIKDYWPAEGHDSEDAIRQLILDDIKNMVEKTTFKNFTLTPVASERVKIGNDEEHTTNTILRGKYPTSCLKLELPNKQFGIKPEGVNTVSWKKIKYMIREATARMHSNRFSKLTPRWHHRIVYEEFAVPFSDLSEIKDMILVFQHSIEALRVIGKAGWIHRDISPGNLYLYTDPKTGEKRGLIGDFEYAKRIGASARFEFRTVTFEFMAVEVEKKEYIFDRRPSESYQGVPTENSVSSTDSKANPFWANYLHDLESIWWIATWTLFTRAIEEPSTSVNNNVILKDFQELFPGFGSSGLQAREKFLKKRHRFGGFINKISHPSPELKKIVIRFRQKLCCAYEIAEMGTDKSSPLLMADNCNIHNELLRMLETVWDEDEDGDINDDYYILSKETFVDNIRTDIVSECSIYATGEDKKKAKGFQHLAEFNSVIENGSVEKLEPVEKNDLVLSDKSLVGDKTVTTCEDRSMYGNGQKRKRPSFELMTRIKMVETGNNRMTTRSMTKTVLSEITLNECSRGTSNRYRDSKKIKLS